MGQSASSEHRGTDVSDHNATIYPSVDDLNLRNLFETDSEQCVDSPLLSNTTEDFASYFADDASSAEDNRSLSAADSSHDSAVRSQTHSRSPSMHSHHRTSSDEYDLKVTCKICFEEKSSRSIYILNNCSHKFCLECLYGYISYKIENFEVDTIYCPTCVTTSSQDRNSDAHLQTMDETEIKQILELYSVISNEEPLPSSSSYLEHESNATEPALYKKYSDFCLKKALLKMDNLIWCPNKECNNAVIFRHPENTKPNDKTSDSFYPGFFDHRYDFTDLPEEEDDNINDKASRQDSLSPQEYAKYRVTCSECNTDICGLCRSFYHDGMTCDESKANRRDSQSLEKWMKNRDAKNCPRCGCLIEKNRGCNHMTCKNCKCDFCWICSKILKGREVTFHFGLISGCKKWNLKSFF